MILGDTNIRNAVRKGWLEIDPFVDEQVQAASYDVRLNRYFKVIDGRAVGALDVREQYGDLYQSYEISEYAEEEPFTLHPGEFALASTIERFEFGGALVGRLEGKSSLGRLGLIVHATAGFFDPGFKGFATLELHNLLRIPIQLYYGMPIAQMSFIQVWGPVSKLYAGKYQDQSAEPQASEYWRNFSEMPTA